jgi:hypothetical protein
MSAEGKLPRFWIGLALVVPSIVRRHAVCLIFPFVVLLMGWLCSGLM